MATRFLGYLSERTEEIAMEYSLSMAQAEAEAVAFCREVIAWQ